MILYKPRKKSTKKYGGIYNRFAAMDARGICSTGWRLPTQADYSTLRAYVDPSGNDSSDYANIAGMHLKYAGIEYWNDPNTGADNSYNFNARSASIRDGDYTGEFSSIGYNAAYWTSSNLYGYPIAISLANNSAILQVAGYSPTPNSGLSIRLVKTSLGIDEVLNDGQAATPYIGNDGKTYQTVKIGLQVWLAQNLRETKYTNGELIPLVEDNTSWILLMDGAMCYYNNDITNA
jgi:uncharacterized protein (TIGR02145 family)